MQQKLTCVKCGAENQPNTPFCLYCGTILETSCPNCGSTVSPSSKFCGMCGAGMGWGTKIKDIQQQIAQSETNLIASVTQSTAEFRNNLANLDNDLRGTLSSYSNQLMEQQQTLSETSSSINSLIKSEHQMALSRTLNRSGLGLIAVGLGIIVATNFIKDIPLLPVIGLAVIFVGFIIQVVSNFLTS